MDLVYLFAARSIISILPGFTVAPHAESPASPNH
jgi:hypothetical protein